MLSSAPHKRWAFSKIVLNTGGQVAGRGVDDLQNLGGRGLLVERFGKLGGALLDLLFELGIGFPQIGGHAVELACEAFELVAGIDLDAAVELAGTNPRRAGVQFPYRPVIRRAIAKAAMAAMPSPISSSTRLRAAWP